MRNTVNLVYLAVYVCATSIQYAHPPTVHQFPYTYVWAIAPLSYPLCLALTHSQTGFWKGLLTILLIPVIAQAVEATVYLVETKEIQYGDTDTVILLGFYLLEPIACVAVCYPVGYLATWLLLRRRSRANYSSLPLA
jgi:hypothetical protein